MYYTDYYWDQGIQRINMYTDVYNSGQLQTPTSQNIQEAFQVLDTNSNTFLSRAEFDYFITNGYMGSGPYLTSGDVDTIFAALDVGDPNMGYQGAGDGKLGMMEWGAGIYNPVST